MVMKKITIRNSLFASLDNYYEKPLHFIQHAIKNNSLKLRRESKKYYVNSDLISSARVSSCDYGFKSCSS